MRFANRLPSRKRKVMAAWFKNRNDLVNTNSREQFSLGHVPRHRTASQLWWWSFFGVVGMTLGLTFEHWSVDRIMAQDAPVLTPSQEAMRLLRKACFEKEGLRGVLVQSCELRQGEITLHVLLDHDRQREPLEQETLSVVSASPRLREWKAAKITLKSATVLPLRSELLPKLQALLATNDLTDARTRQLLRRTRLDDARFDTDGGILFDATSLDAEALAESTLKARPADSAENRLLVEIEELLTGLLPKDAFSKWRLLNNKVRLRALKSPVLEWQAMAVAGEKFDGLELTDAFYDETGRLGMTGSVQKDEQRQTLEKALRPVFDASPICRQREEAQKAIDGLELNSFAAYVDNLRQRMWAKDAPDARRTRVRRVYFVKPGEAAAEAETIDPQLGLAGDAAQAALLAIIQAAHAGILDPELRKQVTKFREVTIKKLPSPVAIVQEAIAKRADLDGVRIDEVAFDSQGRLNFRGQCNAQEEAAALRALLSKSLLAVNHPWAELTFDVTAIHESTRELLTKFRQAAMPFDEVRIDRLWFAEDGHLKVQGIAPEGTEIVNLAESFRNLVAKHLQGQRANALAQEMLIDIATNHPSLLMYLRSKIADDKTLEGVCLDRGFYDIERRFVVEVVQERTEQAALVRTLLMATAETAAWKDYMADGWVADSFRTLPMNPLVACLRKGLPAYSALDGIDISSAFHDSRNRLAFRGTIYISPVENSQERLEKVRAKLEQVLAGHPDWKPRLRLGVSLTNLQIQAPDRELARRATAEAIALIVRRNFKPAIEKLNLAALHDPSDSTTWYLRGLCYRKGSSESREADRDFFRAAVIERIKNGNDWKSRLARIERILDPDARNDADELVDVYRNLLQNRDKLEKDLGIGQCPSTSSKPSK